MWAVVVTTLITFTVYLVEALRWYHVHQTALLDGDAGSVGSLHGAVVWAIVAVPLWSLPFGVIGAAVGRWTPRLWRPLSTVGASRTESASGPDQLQGAAFTQLESAAQEFVESQAFEPPLLARYAVKL